MKRPVYRAPVEQPSDESYRYIPLTRNQVAIVDAADYDWLNQWNWCAQFTPKTHSYRAVAWVNGKITDMARVILGLTDPKIKADHRNHDTLDNRRQNLRPATNAENSRNMRMRKDRFKCVRSSGKKWTSHIGNRHLGMFSTPEEAALAYDRAAKQLHGEFAYTNLGTHGEGRWRKILHGLRKHYASL
jgi:hypothetical protein